MTAPLFQPPASPHRHGRTMHMSQTTNHSCIKRPLECTDLHRRYCFRPRHLYTVNTCFCVKKNTCSTCNQPLSYTSARTCSRDHAFGGGGESRPTCTKTSKDGDGEMKRKAAAKHCCKSWRWHPWNEASSQNGSRFNCSYVIKKMMFQGPSRSQFGQKPL